MRIATLVLLTISLLAIPADAHPVPFSYLDVHMRAGVVEVSLIAHIFDIAHDLNITPPERLLEPGFAGERAEAIRAMLAPRIEMLADSQPLTAEWSGLDVLEDRQSLRLHVRYAVKSTPGTLTVGARMFPYDPTHQTFVNFYESDTLTTQLILDRNHAETEYFAGSRQGIVAVLRKFVPAGIHHILIGPDHLLFLIGLLLLGGTLRQLTLVVTSFTLAHSVTLSLAALSIVTPPARLIEPAIALSIVIVGADNLLAGNGRDLRPWIALGFGLIHGFGFASVLREMELPRQALAWSLFSFNFGVELGQLLVVVVVTAILSAIRSRSESAGRQIAFAGSIAVIAAGMFWFVQRLFFPGSI